MLRFAIPVVLGLCGFGADRFHASHQDRDRREPVIEQCDDERWAARERHEECAPRDERCEPRRERSWHVDIDVRRGGRDEHGDRHEHGGWRR